MTKLSKTQTLLLTAAAARADGALLPPPPGLSVSGRALARSLSALEGRGLAGTGSAKGDDAALRRKEDGSALGLFVTEAGRAAVGVAAPVAASTGAEARRDLARPGGKLGTLLAAIEGEAGATLDELAAATAWLPHTTRAAITRLRQRGFDIRLEERGGRRAYRRAA